MTTDIETLKLQLADIQKQVEKLEAKETTKPKWDLTREYFYLDHVGDIQKVNTHIHSPIQVESLIIALLERLKANGNLYYTRKEAELVARNRKIHVRLKQLANFKPDWSGIKQIKFYLRYNHTEQRLWLCEHNGTQSPTEICFPVGARTWNGLHVEDLTRTIDTEFGEGALLAYVQGSVI